MQGSNQDDGVDADPESGRRHVSCGEEFHAASRENQQKHHGELEGGCEHVGPEKDGPGSRQEREQTDQKVVECLQRSEKDQDHQQRPDRRVAEEA